MKIFQSPTFFKFVKKLEKKFKAEIDKQVKIVAENPEIGEQKRGDLQDVRVQKFKFANCLYLLAYRISGEELQLIMIATHENFYRDLKKYIKKIV